MGSGGEYQTEPREFPELEMGQGLDRSRELQFMDQSTAEVFITVFQMLEKAEQRVCRLSRNEKIYKDPSQTCRNENTTSEMNTSRRIKSRSDTADLRKDELT